MKKKEGWDSNKAPIKIKGIQSMKCKRLIFYICALILPILQFCIFYFGVNISSFTLAFRNFDPFANDGKGGWTWTLWGNFAEVIDTFAGNSFMIGAIVRGILIYLIGQVTFFISIFLAYYIAKKFLFAKVFQVILFLPSIISGMVMILMYKYFVTEAVPFIVRALTGNEIVGLLDSTSYTQTFVTIWFYTILTGLGGNILLFIGEMSNISPSIVEAAKLDGVNVRQDFFLIYLPLIWPTLATFIVLGLPGILTSDIGLYAFYGGNAPKQLMTLGYFMTIKTVGATNDTYPFLAAYGMIITAIMLPIVFGGRAILNKIGEKYD